MFQVGAATRRRFDGAARLAEPDHIAAPLGRAGFLWRCNSSRGGFFWPDQWYLLNFLAMPSLKIPGNVLEFGRPRSTAGGAHGPRGWSQPGWWRPTHHVI